MRGSKYNPMTENEGNDFVQKTSKQYEAKQGTKGKASNNKGRSNNMGSATGVNQYNTQNHNNNRSIDDDDMLEIKGKKRAVGGKRRRRSGGETDEDDEDDFIVGPESNHSMIK